MPASVVLCLALIGISFAGPLVRLSHADPLAIAIWRIGFSLILIAIALVVSGSWRQWSRLDRRGVALACGAGAMLAIHFWSWNASITMTTVSASVVLVDMQPAIVALLSVFWLHEPPTGKQWLGIGIAMAGAFVIALPDWSAAGVAGQRAVVGDLLAFLGAVTGACYFAAGRRLRATLDIWPYVGLVYGTCFVVLVLFALAVRAPVMHQPPRELEIFAALAIGPMLLGHTGFNWSLKYLPAYVVNLTLLGEPVGATVLAALLPGIREVPRSATFLGGALILIGIYVTARAASAASRVAEASESDSSGIPLSRGRAD
ncbi:MAG TPA: DMT family transporter [Gemmatimonadaceae bacterium]|jgi:drug/metabolite transporter (DMT)-like permease